MIIMTTYTGGGPKVRSSGLKEAISVNSKDKKVSEEFIEAVKKDIEDYRQFLIKIGKL